jgi:hypothetical protein
MFCNEDVSDDQGCILHTHNTRASVLLR